MRTIFVKNKKTQWELPVSNNYNHYDWIKESISYLL